MPPLTDPASNEHLPGKFVWADLFNIADFSPVPTWVAWLSLLGFSAMCLVLLARKVKAYEIVR